ncbi:uncharacterized protein EDB93DRAFT_1247722 [Suillus bovinus]|uniref:uncharacterized protein n=1 Tax=Suillus bovinus TaxID=48563 RepID=UPI001B875328|nr:uncharacterized protein EDB93DRAFT_1247722 [Suillus bovinus]KAG2155234.1 hypothetical protein EDB93DRAFT_1247722 [Suillus bovinus]
MPSAAKCPPILTVLGSAKYPPILTVLGSKCPPVLTVLGLPSRPSQPLWTPSPTSSYAAAITILRSQPLACHCQCPHCPGVGKGAHFPVAGFSHPLLLLIVIVSALPSSSLSWGPHLGLLSRLFLPASPNVVNSALLAHFTPVSSRISRILFILIGCRSSYNESTYN